MQLTNQQIRVKLFESLRNSFLKKTVIFCFFLLFVLLITAFSLVVVRFEYKLQLNEQKKLILESIDLDEQWSQIVLEYSSLATPTAVENFAKKENMVLPTSKNIGFLNEQKEGVNDQ
ncbi:MAG: cell division protein FtsL [Francisella sp.]